MHSPLFTCCQLTVAGAQRSTSRSPGAGSTGLRHPPHRLRTVIARCGFRQLPYRVRPAGDTHPVPSRRRTQPAGDFSRVYISPGNEFKASFCRRHWCQCRGCIRGRPRSHRREHRRLLARRGGWLTAGRGRFAGKMPRHTCARGLLPPSFTIMSPCCAAGFIIHRVVATENPTIYKYLSDQG